MPEGDDWIAVSEEPLPAEKVLEWTVRPGCGALVTFFGTVRDHSDARERIVALEYEAYGEHVESRLNMVAAAARTRWPEIGRMALLHRVGRMELQEISVIVAISTPHRIEGFQAAKFCIDTLKESVPIWKREIWDGGSAWVACTSELTEQA